MRKDFNFHQEERKKFAQKMEKEKFFFKGRDKSGRKGAGEIKGNYGEWSA